MIPPRPDPNVVERRAQCQALAELDDASPTRPLAAVIAPGASAKYRAEPLDQENDP